MTQVRKIVITRYACGACGRMLPNPIPENCSCGAKCDVSSNQLIAPSTQNTLPF